MCTDTHKIKMNNKQPPQSIHETVMIKSYVTHMSWWLKSQVLQGCVEWVEEGMPALQKGTVMTLS